MLNDIIDQIEAAPSIEDLKVVVKDLLESKYKEGFNRGYLYGKTIDEEDEGELFEDDGA
jgi:hypothetical protein